MQFGTIRLRKGRAKALRNHHPWIFSGAIADVRPGSGALFVVKEEGRDEFLGQAYYNAKSQIAARVISFDPDEDLASLMAWRARFAALSKQRREYFKASTTDSYRLCFSEADGLPGLVVERFGDGLVVQFLTKGMQDFSELIIDALQAELAPRFIVAKADQKAGKLEGFAPLSGILRGKEPQTACVINQDDIRYEVQVGSGQKTGFYFDQRDNRLLCRELAGGKSVLDCFSYSGGFALTALRGGAESVTVVDSSEAALQLARRNLELNGLPKERYDERLGDAFELLRQEVAAAKSYDLVILDPPKLAHTAGQVNKAARAYKDLNRLGMQLVKPGGLLMTYSCSGHVSLDLLQKIVFAASEEAGRQGQILRLLLQAGDHPVRLSVPESLYLKGFLCRIL